MVAMDYQDGAGSCKYPLAMLGDKASTNRGLIISIIDGIITLPVAVYGYLL